MTNRKPSPMLPIVLTAFIDMVGIGIIFPVFSAIFIQKDSPILDPSVSDETRKLLYGLLAASYPAAQFFGAPLLGLMSDKYGRRKVLLFSLAGTLAGYGLLGLAVQTGSLWLMFVSRSLAGFSGGNISVAYSAAADVSTPENRAKNFGLVGMSFGLGFVLGPFLGGVLSDPKISSWFNDATPFWATTALTLVNFFVVLFVFDETLKQRVQTRLDVWTGFKNFRMAFADRQLRSIFTVVFLIALGFAFFTQFFQVLVQEKYGFQKSDIGMMYAWVGVWVALTQGFLLRLLMKKWNSRQILKISFLVLSLSVGAIMLPPESWMIYWIIPFIAMSQGSSLPNINAVVSTSVSAGEQGKIIGMNQAVMAMGNVIPPVVAGFISSVNMYLPTIAAAVLLFLGWLTYVFVYLPSWKKSIG